MSMKWENTGMKSNLARAKGLGAAGHGPDHWIAQRITAIANIPLVIWAVYSIIGLIGMDFYDVTDWLGQPMNAILMILFIISTFYHAILGAQVVTEDYIHNEGFKVFKLLAQKLFLGALGVACVFSILKVAL